MCLCVVWRAIAVASARLQSRGRGDAERCNVKGRIAVPLDTHVQRVQRICERKVTTGSAPMIARPKVCRLKHSRTQHAIVVAHALSRVPHFERADIARGQWHFVVGRGGRVVRSACTEVVVNSVAAERKVPEGPRDHQTWRIAFESRGAEDVVSEDVPLVVG